jgi:hypothetical protein
VKITAQIVKFLPPSLKMATWVVSLDFRLAAKRFLDLENMVLVVEILFVSGTKAVI